VHNDNALTGVLLFHNLACLPCIRRADDLFRLPRSNHKYNPPLRKPHCHALASISLVLAFSLQNRMACFCARHSNPDTSAAESESSNTNPFPSIFQP
jgi:hypothetical protein